MTGVSPAAANAAGVRQLRSSVRKREKKGTKKISKSFSIFRLTYGIAAVAGCMVSLPFNCSLFVRPRPFVVHTLCLLHGLMLFSFLGSPRPIFVSVSTTIQTHTCAQTQLLLFCFSFIPDILIYLYVHMCT